MNISVVIPVYNRAKQIKRAVDSVLQQSFKPAEIIVVDDGSTDNTADVLSAFADDIQVVRQANLGVSAARNSGIRQASGEWIALLDSDDEWLPAKLQNHTRFFENNRQLNIFQCEEIWIRNGRRVNQKIKHKKYGGYIFEKCLPLCIISPSSVIFKKTLWQEMNGFDEAFPVCEDYDLWLRISSEYPVGLDHTAGVIKYGGHDDQLSRMFSVIDEYRLKALEKQIANTKLNGSQRVQVIREAMRKTAIIINGARKREKDTAIWEEKMGFLNKKLTEI